MEYYCQKFKQFLKEYDENNPDIIRKINHSYRVADYALEIAKSLNLPDDELDLAYLCGLIHDVGRFGQMRKYHTYDDLKSINHGTMGLKMLEQGLIKDFTLKKSWQEIIKKAVVNHNKTWIDEDLSEKEKLYVQITRDADKLDLFYLMINNFPVKTSDEKINDAIYERVMSLQVGYENSSNNLDKYVIRMGFFLDLNFKYSKMIALKEQYLEKYVDKVIKMNPQEKERLEKIKEKIIEKLKKEVDERC